MHPRFQLYQDLMYNSVSLIVISARTSNLFQCLIFGISVLFHSKGNYVNFNFFENKKE